MQNAEPYLGGRGLPGVLPFASGEGDKGTHCRRFYKETEARRGPVMSWDLKTGLPGSKAWSHRTLLSLKRQGLRGQWYS